MMVESLFMFNRHKFNILRELKLSISYIPDKTKFILWGKSAGRCNYCNCQLYFDPLTKTEFNTAYIAHIIADKSGGPRGDAVLSEDLKSDISNLMLMCDVHHRLIDREDVEGHSVEFLRKMKADHEARIELQTRLTEENQTHLLLYGANIGNHSSPLTWQIGSNAIFPDRYPADTRAIEIGLSNSASRDDEEHYWPLEKTNLEKNFQRLVKNQINDGHIKHLSVFALAPQPLLIELGRLISDLIPTNVFQLKREPTTWSWLDGDTVEYELKEPTAIKSQVALNISLSATIDNSRITDILGDDISIWTLTFDEPNNDYLKTEKSLENFRVQARKAFEKIKAKHGHGTILNVFPAMPVSAAVEFGRVWQPKADMEMIIYDENRTKGGFIKALEIKNTEI